MVHIRVDTKVKAKAAKTFAKMGLTVSDAMRILLARVAAERQRPLIFESPITKLSKLLRQASGARFSELPALRR
jgi:DNA-damage-inducible protein J